MTTTNHQNAGTTIAPPNVSPSLTLTVKELMQELHISKNTAYELTEQPDFPVFRVGSRKLINRKKLQEWLDRQVGSAS